MTRRLLRLQIVWWGWASALDPLFGRAIPARALRRCGLAEVWFVGPFEVRVWAFKPNDPTAYLPTWKTWSF